MQEVEEQGDEEVGGTSEIVSAVICGEREPVSGRSVVSQAGLSFFPGAR